MTEFFDWDDLQEYADQCARDMAFAIAYGVDALMESRKIDPPVQPQPFWIPPEQLG